MKAIQFFIFCFTLFLSDLTAQHTLQEVLGKIEIYAPEANSHLISDQRSAMDKSNVNKNLLPQLNIFGQSTYQSDVTFLDINVPGIEIHMPSAFQYKLQGEVSQLIYDGGLTNLLKKSIEIQSQISKWQAQLKIEELQIRAIHIYFSILEIREHRNIIIRNQEDLQAQADRLKDAFENGIVLESELNELKVSMIQLDQNLIDLATQESIYLDFLSLLTGDKYETSDHLKMPDDLLYGINGEIDRAYYHIIDWQKSGIDARLSSKRAAANPKLSGFGQLGVGRPGLNFLKNDLAGFYVFGVRFKMDLGNLYTSNNDTQIAKLDKEQLELNKNMYTRDLNMKIGEYQMNILRFSEKMENELKLLEIKENIHRIAKAQFENGSMSSADYLIKFNDVSRSKLTIGLTAIEKLKHQYLLKYSMGDK